MKHTCKKKMKWAPTRQRPFTATEENMLVKDGPITKKKKTLWEEQLVNPPIDQITVDFKFDFIFLFFLPSKVDNSHVIGQKDEEISKDKTRACDIQKRFLAPYFLHDRSSKYTAEETAQT